MFDPYSDGRVRIPPLAPPLLPKEIADLPRGEDWIYEFCWGGERVRAVKRDAGVLLVSRDGRELTNRFPQIAASVAKLRAGSVVLDGEILYLESFPPPALQRLAEIADDFCHAGFALLVYDLLADEGKDTRGFSLLCRRLLLASIVQGTPIVLSPLADGNPDNALAAATQLGLRGVVAKRAGSPYRPNSLVNDWVKKTFPPKAAAAAALTRSPFAGDDRDASTAGVPAGVS